MIKESTPTVMEPSSLQLPNLQRVSNLVLPDIVLPTIIILQFGSQSSSPIQLMFMGYGRFYPYYYWLLYNLFRLSFNQRINTKVKKLQTYHYFFNILININNNIPFTSLDLPNIFTIYIQTATQKYNIAKKQVPIYLLTSMYRSKAKSTHEPSINRSFRIGGSLAEQNQVRNFNKSRNNKSMAPSMPHRIQLPLFFNTPSRFVEDKNVANKTQNDEVFNHDKVDNGVFVTVQRRLKDYQMLAFGCRRAGKIRDQGRAYYSIGVLYDNIKKYKKAVEYYEKFLQVCKSISDSHGEALAYNCIGVDYQLMGEKDPEHIPKAIEYHRLHEQLADVNGKFLASINLGLCYDRIANSKQSIFWFQNALKHSVQMSNLSGQSLAIGNIGRIGTKNLSENKDKMKLFVQKYLKLAEQMNDPKAEMEGAIKLGLINSTKKNFDEGKQKFERALKLAEEAGNKEVYNEAKFGYAVVNAEKEMDNFLASYSYKIGPRKLV